MKTNTSRKLRNRKRYRYNKINKLYLEKLGTLGKDNRFVLLLYMPEISRFFGIVIRMYTEVGSPHHIPHFHAYYQDETGIYSLEPIELIAGSLPKRQQRLIEAWAELHQKELLNDWQLLQRGRKPLPIQPLT